MAVLSKIIIKQTRSECLCKKIPITSDNTLSKQEYKASFIIVLPWLFYGTRTLLKEAMYYLIR